MAGDVESIPLGECPLSRSKDQLTSQSTVFTLSRSESLWTGEAPGARHAFWFPLHLMTTGGSFLLCGFVISGLYFAGHCRRVTNILGPALVSIGLMVLVVGVVLIPITKENLQRAAKKPPACYRPPAFNL